MNDTLNAITSTIASEFSDVPDAAQATRIVVRLFLAAVLGGLLGWQREANGKAAGLRTHMLVAMGSALIVLVSLQSGVDTANAARVVQGVITGVGFLGAGAILKSDGENAAPHVKGLTTAAGLWLTAAIGVCAGLGEEATAVISTIFALLILSVIPMLTKSSSSRQTPKSDET